MNRHRPTLLKRAGLLLSVLSGSALGVPLLGILGISPAGATATHPKADFSYYIQSPTNLSTPTTLGCDDANRDAAYGTDSLVILDFGGQESEGGVGGTLTPFTDEFASAGDILGIMNSFAKGYQSCADGATFLDLAMGTNSSLNVSTSAGQAWANLVTTTSSYIASQGYSDTDVTSADDIEPDFSTPSPVLAWFTGYQSVTTGIPVYNFGSADGCPPYGSCNNGWTQADVHTVSYGDIVAYAYPEIFEENGAQAAQWADISSSQGYIGFTGALSQALTCYDMDPSDPESVCPGTYNGPDEAWGQLSAATGQSPPYESDIGLELG